MRPPSVEIDRTAAEAVLRSMSEDTDAESVAMPCELIGRGSTVLR